MSDESSIDGSEWHHEGDLISWDSEDDLAVLMSQLCRVCGEASEDLVECFGKKGKEMLLVDKIHTHLPIMVTEEDLLPVNVCSSCVSKLEICHKMVINCLEADGRMRNLLGFDLPAGYEDLYNYDRPMSRESVASSTKTEKSQEDDSIDLDMKENSEVENIKEEIEPSEEEKNDSKSEERTSYRVILLKMKKSDNVSAETQLQKALTFLETGGKTFKVITSTCPGEPTENVLEKKNSDNNSPAIEENTKSDTVVDQESEDASNKPAEEKAKESNDWEDVYYECIYCDGNIIGRNNFITHQRVIHENEVISCNKCELVFEEKEDYEEHNKTHEKEKTNAENVTQPESSEYVSENGKRKIEPEEKVVKKLKTDDLFPLDESILRQIEAESDGMYWMCKVWQCKLCNDMSLTKQGWRDHVCDVQELLLCVICGNNAQFFSEKDLEKHYQLFHGEERLEDESNQSKDGEDTKYQCPTCEEIFDSWLQLCQHSKSHLGHFKCPHCERTFNRQSNLANHIKRHKTETGFTCRICLETFSNRGGLLSHRRTHTREELLGLKPFTVKEEDGISDDTNAAAPYRCPICYRALETKQELDSHIALHTDSSYPCHICGKVLSKKNTLEYHLRTHTGEKPYTCSMCPGAFQSRVGLIVHERIHTGEKPYQCDQCDMAFRCRATLNQHKVVHSEERPYQCTHCGRGFRRRDTLDTHIRTHTDERPYACRICSRAFRQKGDCSKHEKTHNKHKSVVMLGDTEIYNCPLCGQMYELKEDLDSHFENEHTPEEKASSIVIINSENVITIPGIATVAEEGDGLVLQEL